MNYYLECFKKYATFEGRARRKEYWMFILFNIIAVVICAIIDGLLTAGILTGLYSLAIIIPGISVAVRRLHDTGRSGGWWWIGCVPMIGGIWLLVLMCLEGDAGDNKYGPDPKAEDAAPQE